MYKFWVIFKREYAQVVKKKSFIIGIFLIPVMMSAFMLLPALLARQKSSQTEQMSIIDRSGLHIGERFKENLAEYTLEDSDIPYYNVNNVYNIPFEDQSEFKRVDSILAKMITEKKLKYYLVIGNDPHLADSSSYLVSNDINFVSINRFTRQLSRIISKHRLTLAEVNLPVDSIMKLTYQVNLSIKDIKGETISFQVKYFTAIIFVMIIYGMIFGYGTMVMRSIIEEKNSRIMEVLISSSSPFQLMMGKITGLCGATLTQVFIWIAVGFLIYSFKSAFSIDPGIDRVVFNPLVALSFMFFLTTGFVLYSAIFSLLGSIVNSDKEAQPFIFPIAMMLIMPVMVGISIVQNPNSVFATVLSLVPFTSPTTMVMRIIFVAPYLTEYSLTSGIVGEAILSFLILCATIIAMVWFTSKVFRIGVLMYGKRPTLPEILKWVRYK